MSDPTPGQAAHDPRTCGDCQSMIARGGHRFMDIMGHAAYLAVASRHPVPPWAEVREAFAQAALAATGGWGPCDTFDTWMESQGHEDIHCGEYRNSDMLAAFEAGARSALAEAVTTARPPATQPQPASGIPLRSDAETAAMLRADLADAEAQLARWPRCPAGCSCRLGFEGDADRNECGCDGPCNGGPQPAPELAALRNFFWNGMVTLESPNPEYGYVPYTDLNRLEELFEATLPEEGAEGEPAPAQPAPELAEVARLREALAAIDPAKLELLAEWFDRDDDRRGRDSDREVQSDLRRWAKIVRAAGLPS